VDSECVAERVDGGSQIVWHVAVGDNKDATFQHILCEPGEDGAGIVYPGKYAERMPTCKTCLDALAVPRTEWGVARDNTPYLMHRGPMSEEDAREWIREWEDDVAPNAKSGMFVLIRREVGPWEKAS
jgi:hypothetical protein